MSQLGTIMPLNGGPQEFLARCLDDSMGFLASLGMIFALMPCSAAVLTLFVADSACEAFGYHDMPAVYRKLGALGVIVLLTIINCAGNTQSKVVTKLLLACKISGLALILILGLSSLVLPSDRPPVSREPSLPTSPNLSSYADAALQALWAYSGWETVCFRRHPFYKVVALTENSLPSLPAR